MRDNKSKIVKNKSRLNIASTNGSFSKQSSVRGTAARTQNYEDFEDFNEFEGSNKKTGFYNKKGINNEKVKNNATWINNTTRTNNKSETYNKTGTKNRTEAYNITETYNKTGTKNRTEAYNITETYNKAGTKNRTESYNRTETDNKTGVYNKTRKDPVTVKKTDHSVRSMPVKGRNNKPEGMRKSKNFPEGKENQRKNSRNNTEDKFRNTPFEMKKNTAPGREGCPYRKECGGCNYLKHSYEAELKEKQKMVEDLLKGYCRVEPIIGMKQPVNYRNKVHAVFDHDRKGNPISGVYEEGTHRVIAIDNCIIHNRKADEIIASIRGMLKSFKIKTYDEDTGYGLLRHVLIRTGYTSGQIMVVLVLSSPIFPSKNNFVKALLKQHPDISTIVLNINDKQTSMVLGEKEQVIYGRGYIEDSLCGKLFRISPKSFYQVNPSQTEVLYRKAIKLAGLTGNESVIDAYCGTGTIGIIASDYAKQVIGVELNRDAVRDAVTNAKRNEASNISFYNNDAGEFLSQMAAKNDTADVVFLDPPRTGSTEQFMDSLVQLKPKKVVYISCNPITLERDLKYLNKKGYKAQIAAPVDMFPWTGHVETVCCLQRVNM